MKISKNIGVGVSGPDHEKLLLGVASETGECGGCGGEVFILRIGLLVGEVYFTHHKH